ncbi:MAG: Trehalose synthase [Candidatus Omnitrophica bacterium]|nr:Trehalose synthase [Candidatus Omnitrophota bacterium]
MPVLSDYRAVAGPQTLDEVRFLGDRLKGRRLLHVNSTAVGGTVAETLHFLMPLFRELGLEARWEVIKGGEDFHTVVRKMRQALQGGYERFELRDYDLYLRVQEENLGVLPADHDLVMVHDPEPAGLVRGRRPGSRWVWRSHLDLSQPDPVVWNFMRGIVGSYEMTVTGSPSFAQDLERPQAVIHPSIDPLNEKNRLMAPEEISAVLERLQIPNDKPLITQICRLDTHSDPVGAIRSFRLAGKAVDARLLIVGAPADDEPGGEDVYDRIREEIRHDPLIHLLRLPHTRHAEINAIQRASAVILQRAHREGFGLTVTEALWKGRPVIASPVGGIPLQISHRKTGLLAHSDEGTAYWIKQLFQDPGMAVQLGENGREHVRRCFLATRQLRDYLLLFISLESPGDQVSL